MPELSIEDFIRARLAETPDGPLKRLVGFVLESHEVSADWRPTDYRAGYGAALDDALSYVAALWEDHVEYKSSWSP